ncbi:BET1-like protein [Eurytemora carolleeae]|uniref:BET1-like protein n=1 Tax=Eurytemora carolleeae TaxID=1294199 RepID=UPI000C793E21|nr:BET1-like protein [Eurytemora carolleeae]|eukprot:XP_023319529.1 BET1-like protein [Eurytemora affinis]
MGSRNGWSNLSEEAVDKENRDYQERLSSKAAYLKSLAFDIETEAKDHHRLLDDVGGDFDTSTGLLGGTLSRVQKLLGQGRTNRQIMCYTILVIIFTFIILTYIISSSRS